MSKRTVLTQDTTETALKQLTRRAFFSLKEELGGVDRDDIQELDSFFWFSERELARVTGVEVKKIRAHLYDIAKIGTPVLRRSGVLYAAQSNYKEYLGTLATN